MKLDSWPDIYFNYSMEDPFMAVLPVISIQLMDCIIQDLSLFLWKPKKNYLGDGD